MVGSVTIRPGTPADGAAILRVHRRAILALGRATHTRDEARSWAAGLAADHYGAAMTGGLVIDVVDMEKVVAA